MADHQSDQAPAEVWLYDIDDLQSYSPWLVLYSSALPTYLRRLLPPGGWPWGRRQDWHWSLGWEWRWGLSHYLPACLLGLLWAMPLSAQPVVTTPPGADQGVQVVEPVDRVAVVRIDAGRAEMRRSTPAKDHGREAQEKASARVVLLDQPRGAMLPGEANSTPKPRTKQYQQGPWLEIPDSVFSDAQLHSLVEDWLVPRLVDTLVRELLAGSQDG